MSFEIDLNEQPEVWWPVDIHQPLDGGKTQKHTVNVRYKLMDSEKLKAMGETVRSFTVLCEHITGLGDEFVDKTTGEKMLFNEANLKALLAKPWIQRALAIGLVNASSGAAAKNS